MIPARRLLLATLAAAVAVSVTGPVAAQTYPSKQVTIIVSFPPGGDTDALARVFAEKLAQRMGQAVVVENRTGASGTIGNSFVSKAAPDGYTILFTPNTFSIAPLVLKPGVGAQYDVLNGFTPILLAGTSSLFAVATAQSGVKNMQELVAAAKGGKISTYASPGSGSPMHILGELFNKSAGVKINQVPYRGSGPAVNDMLGGHVPFMYTTLGPVAQHVAAGKLVILGVADARRSPLAPQIPTFAEAGFRDAEVGAWQGFMGPPGMSASIVGVLNGHLNEILKMPDVLQRLNALYLEPRGGDPAEIAKVNAADFNKYRKVIREFNIQAE